MISFVDFLMSHKQIDHTEAFTSKKTHKISIFFLIFCLPRLQELNSAHTKADQAPINFKKK